jgi:hypothetical protein
VERFEALVSDLPWAWIGSVTPSPTLDIIDTSGTAFSIPIARLARAWRGADAP